LLRLGMPSHSASILFQHGLGTAQGRTESGYMIDLDFAAETKTEVSDAEAVITRLHEGVGRAFRWCIRDVLHDALGPTEVADSMAKPFTPVACDSLGSHRSRSRRKR